MSVDRFLARNREWVADCLKTDPDYFRRRAAQHRPRGLLIGCSDARVPTEIITGTEVGELFVHRNIANQVQPTDQNLMAIIQYAVEVLHVRDIIVCGHEQCGGVKASLGSRAPSHVEGWIASARQVARMYEEDLHRFPDEDSRLQHFVELNVREQVRNLSRLPVLVAARENGIMINLHGWVYGISNGLLRDLHVMADWREDEVATSHTHLHQRRAG